MRKEIICRGDLFYIDFGNNAGSVQSGERPVLVLQGDDYNRNEEKILTIAHRFGRRFWLKEAVNGAIGTNQNSE